MAEQDTSRKYHSILDQVTNWKGQNLTYKREAEGSWKKDLVDAIGDLEIALEYRGLPDSLITRVASPSRIIRGVIEHKIAHPEQRTAPSLIPVAVDLGCAVYRDAPDALAKASKLRFALGAVDPTQEIFHTVVEHGHDSLTWESTEPRFSEATAERLALEVHEGRARKDILMIPLAHGGVSAGMDTFLRYCDKTGSEQSLVFPVRCSIDKKNDTQPQVSDVEKEYLRRMGVGRQVIIFDEDWFSGKTVGRANWYFKKEVFPEDQPSKIVINKRY